VKSLKKNKEDRNIWVKKEARFNRFVIVTFLVGVLLIVATYAWFSVSLNVSVENFDFLYLVIVDYLSRLMVLIFLIQWR
jgi:uncharacterized protein involved in cysteine biosynthesis